MAENRIERRLAAIMAADMVGYSRLMEADEKGTIARQKAHRNELIDPKIAEHSGRIVKTTGDGLLVEFASVVDAVECAVVIQRAMVEREADASEDHRIQYRIGINVGDIIIDGDDILGEGVNVAARLETLCEPGGVALSGNVYEQVQGKLDESFKDAGAHEVKNIAKPVHVWRWTDETGGPAESGKPPEALPLPDKPSIAVLAFDNLSGDPEQEYFADGIAEDIITGLSRLRWLFVIARNSSFAYKGESPDVRRVASELGVRYVLEGSVRKAGNKVRISAQLIDAASGNHVWAERYDRELEDIFEVQDEITWNIVAALGPELTLAEIERSRRKRPETLDAWDLVMRAQPLFHRFRKAENAQAQDLLRAAVRLDPNYAAANAWLAWCLTLEGLFGWSESSAHSLAEALRTAQFAVENDPNDPEAKRILAVVLCFMSRQEEATEAASHALELNPNCAIARGTLGAVLSLTGRSDEAIEACQMALRASPRDPFRAFWIGCISNAHFAAGRLEEALEWARKSVQAGPGWYGFYLNVAFLSALLGRREEAQRAVQEILRMLPRLTVTRVLKNPLYTRPTDIARLAEGLRKAGLPE